MAAALLTACSPVAPPSAARRSGEVVVKCHDDFDADVVVVEVNFGGETATEVVKLGTAVRAHQREERQTNLIRVKENSASRGKAMRAEPTIGPRRADDIRKPDGRTYWD